MLPTAYISNPFSLFRPSVKILRRNLKTLILGFLLVVLIVCAVLAVAVAVIYFATVGHLGSARVVVGAAALLGIGGILATVIFFSPFQTVVLLRSARDKPISLKEALAGCKANYWQILRVNFLTSLAVLGGLILLIIPGFIFAVWFSLANYIVIDQQVDAVEAMKRSKALVRGRVWEMMGVFALPAFFEFFTLIPIIGPFIVTLFGLLYSPASVARYVQLKAARKQDGPMPAVDPINYAVVIAACIVVVLVAVIRLNEMPATSAAGHSSPGYHMMY